MNFHDTHFHLDLMTAPEKKVDEIEKSGVYTIAVTNSPSVFFYTQKLTAKKKYVRAALGFHPELIAQRFKELDLFLNLLSQTRYIGEIGLDRRQKSHDNFEKQVTAFKKIVEVCRRSGDKIMTIHSRKAELEILEIIGPNFPGQVILHWFSGPVSLVPQAVSNGYYFSVNLRMFSSKSGLQIIDKIPMECILLESDAPFTFKEGESYNQGYFEKIIAELAQVKNLPISQVHNFLFTNFKTLILPITN